MNEKIQELELRHNWSTLDYCAPLTEEEKEALKELYLKLDAEFFTVP